MVGAGGRGRIWMMRIVKAALAAALLATGALAQQAPAPVLPPPGSLVTPPAAPNPLAPPQAAPPPAQAPEQNRMPEIGGPTEIVLEAKPVLLLRGQSNWDDGFENLMEAFKKLREEAVKHKLAVVGRPQAAFISTDDFGFKYEAMLTLEQAPPQPPRLSADFALSQSPSGRALKFTHSGAYDDIDTTYEAITAYLDEKGLKARNLFIEEYLTEPKTSEDADLQMDILVLVE
jgi:effector-binding domain-containing protein